MVIHLNEDFKDFLRLLISHQVKFLIVGGYAVGVHGYPRYTGNLDIWISPDDASIEGLTKAVREFGFDLPEVKPELFRKSEKIIRMGYPPDRIELFTTISGVSFDDCFKQCFTLMVDEISVCVIGFEDLIANKKAAGRLKDLTDVEGLNRIQDQAKDIKK